MNREQTAEAIKVMQGFVDLALDADLRPLRDGPGEDETLQWCPPPIKELA